jgi:hypothetical protein
LKFFSLSHFQMSWIKVLVVLTFLHVSDSLTVYLQLTFPSSGPIFALQHCSAASNCDFAPLQLPPFLASSQSPYGMPLVLNVSAPIALSSFECLWLSPNNTMTSIFGQIYFEGGKLRELPYQSCFCTDKNIACHGTSYMPDGDLVLHWNWK